MPDLAGFSECWGISILHCPYCDAYEVSDTPIGVIANGNAGFELAKLVHNWTKKLTLFTNGIATLTSEQIEKLGQHGIGLFEKEIRAIEHENGRVKHLLFKDGSTFELSAIFSKVTTVQHCDLPQKLGCELTDAGLIKIDDTQQTSMAGIFAAGDNSTPYRAVAVAVASGTKAGAYLNKALIDEHF
jgi:thioredoxin reductase